MSEPPQWPDRAAHTQHLVDAALQAADPYRLTADYLYAHPSEQATYVLAIGKAAGRMAQAAEDVLAERIAGGLVITKHDHPGAHALPTHYAGHPVPDEAGVQAATALQTLTLDPLPDGARWLVLLSGGGSALLTSPAPGITLGDLQDTTTALLASGATINDINVLRKHLSQVKGGQLARLLYPAPVTQLVLSDVVGNPLDAIASGPLVGDPTTFDDCAAICSRFGLWQSLPANVTARLQAGSRGDVADTPVPGDPLFVNISTQVIGDVARAAAAMAAAASELGFAARVLATDVQGEAGTVAAALVDSAHEPGCYIWGGETTVTLGDNPGTGGRNQELALAAAVLLQRRQQVRLFTLATDGGDGPTDAAGAVAEPDTVARGNALGLDADDYLRRHDAYPFFAALDDLIHTGPTGTNVNDLTTMLVY